MGMVMSAVGRRWVVGLALLGGLAVAARGDDPPGTGTLSGRLVDPDGRPAAGVRVWREGLIPGGGGRLEAVETRTDEAGHFSIGPLTPAFTVSGSALYAVAPGFAVAAIPYNGPSIRPGGDRDLGVFRLDRGRVFTGAIKDTDGTPRAGVAVEVGVKRNYMGHTIGDLVPEVVVTTDAAGRFRTPPLPIGHLGLRVRVPGRQQATFYRPIDPPGEEDLGVIPLEPDFPIPGIVRDLAGHPLADVRIGGTVGLNTRTDVQGRFVLSGFGPNPSFQLNVTKPGYQGLVGRVTGRPGAYTYTRGAGGAPAAELEIVLEPTGAIEGTTIDAATGAAVAATRVVVRPIVRNPAGVVASLGPAADFPQDEPGRLSARFPQPGEYRLTVSAPGYEDAEVDTPRAASFDPIAGVVARLARRADAAPAPAPIAAQRIVGRITRDGRPVREGWVSTWQIRPVGNPINAPVLRGRLMVAPPGASPAVPIRDGSYTLELAFPRPNVIIVVDEPGQALAQVGPVAVAAGETKTLDIACPAGGTIRGRVAAVPEGWEGYGWVVACNRAGLRVETRVGGDGSFAFPPLPPGEYGLKVGHDAYDDAEVYPGLVMQQHPEAFNMVADPWKRAKLVTVEPGRLVDGVEVDWPE